MGVVSERKAFSEIDNSEREFAKSKIPGGGRGGVMIHVKEQHGIEN